MKLKLTCAKLWKNTARIVVLSLVASVFGCQLESTGPITKWGNFIAKIEVDEGDLFRIVDEQNQQDQPWPAFGATIQDLKSKNTPQILIYGKNLERGEQTSFSPAAVFKVEYKGETLKWVVASPVDPSKQTLVFESYYDFQKSCMQCKFDLEKWVQKQLPEAIYLGWEDEIAADKWLRSVLRTPYK